MILILEYSSSSWVLAERFKLPVPYDSAIDNSTNLLVPIVLAQYCSIDLNYLMENSNRYLHLPFSDMRVELIKGRQAENNGPVRVSVGGLTGRVCSNGWTDSAASVVCRQLGYRGGKAYQLTPLVSVVDVNSLGIQAYKFALPFSVP